MTEQTGYDATLDPLTGRPIVPLDAENARKDDVEGGENEDEDPAEVEEDDDPDGDEEEVEEGEEIPKPIFSHDEGHVSSAEQINGTSPRMKGRDIERKDYDEDLIDRNIYQMLIAVGLIPVALIAGIITSRDLGHA